MIWSHRRIQSVTKFEFHSHSHFTESSFRSSIERGGFFKSGGGVSIRGLFDLSINITLSCMVLTGWGVLGWFQCIKRESILYFVRQGRSRSQSRFNSPLAETSNRQKHRIDRQPDRRANSPAERYETADDLIGLTSSCGLSWEGLSIRHCDWLSASPRAVNGRENKPRPLLQLS